MRVSEIFHSIQGEGALAGVCAVFIRLAGCPLRCRWCDTRYAWDRAAGREMTVEAIVEQAGRFDCGFAVVTGGEPMADPDLAALLGRLAAQYRHITVETAGIAFVPRLPCDLMSISPKLSNSTPRSSDSAAAHHDRIRLNQAALNSLIRSYEYRLKFVIESADDLPQVRRLLDDLPGIDRSKVMLMPQAATRIEYLAKAPLVAEMCRQTGLAFSPRLQVILWDNARGR